MSVSIGGKATDTNDSSYTLRAYQLSIGSLMINDSAWQVEQVSVESDDMMKFICKDFFTGKRLEMIIPGDSTVKMPEVKHERCLVLSICPEGRTECLYLSSFSSPLPCHIKINVYFYQITVLCVNLPMKRKM